MPKIQNVKHVLKTLFNVDSGMSECDAIAIYKRSVLTSGKLECIRDELEAALREPAFSWVGLLANDEYEVFDAATEEQAKAYAMKILWEPLRDL